jgi:hypothetical protein
MIIEESSGEDNSGNDSASSGSTSTETPQRPDTEQHKPETIVVIRGGVRDRGGSKPEGT